MIAGNTLLAGLGSPYGDDQFGWRLVDALRQRRLSGVGLVRLRSADELLDWLPGVVRLVVCDACQGAGAVGTWHRWRWPAAELSHVRSTGTHDLGLAAVLHLAERLGELPPEVAVWAVEGAPAEPGCLPGGDLSPDVQRSLPQLAALISAELTHA